MLFKLHVIPTSNARALNLFLILFAFMNTIYKTNIWLKIVAKINIIIVDADKSKGHKIYVSKITNL